MFEVDAGKVAFEGGLAAVGRFEAESVAELLAARGSSALELEELDELLELRGLACGFVAGF